MNTVPNPLRPLNTVTQVLSWLVGLPVIGFLFSSLVVLGWYPGASDDPDQSIPVDAGNTVSTPHVTAPLPGLKHGVSPVWGVSGLTIEAPTMVQRIEMVLHQLPQLAFYVGALFLLLRFLRRATEEGPYGSTVPSGLRTLGWYLIAAGPVCALISALAAFALRNSAVSGIPALSWLDDWGSNMPWTAVIVGAAALTFARILRIGVRMNEELEGTV